MAVNPELIDWDAKPETERIAYVPILSPKPGETVMAVIVSSRLLGVNTHFQYNRTQPCITLERGCEGCHANLTTRWKGYLGVWHTGFSRYMIAELTSAAVADCAPVLLEKGRDLRGYLIKAWRVGKARNAPVRCEVQPPPLKGGVVPADFDVRSALLRVWQRSARETELLKDDQGHEQQKEGEDA